MQASARQTEELWRLFDVLNIACGGHAGDAVSMKRLVEFCAREGVRVGAHPSYPDREGFGRRTLAIGRRSSRRALPRSASSSRRSRVTPAPRSNR
jgi:UPF0271 protein